MELLMLGVKLGQVKGYGRKVIFWNLCELMWNYLCAL